MRLSAKLLAAAGMFMIAAATNSQAASLNFVGYIDGPGGVGEHAVVADLTSATYLSTYTVAAHGSVVAAVGNAVPVGFDNYATVPQAYLDGGGAGIGVCKVVSGTQCNPTSDDNVTGPASGGGNPEVLSVAFTNQAADANFLVSNIQLRNEGHTTTFAAGKFVNVSTDGSSWTTYAIGLAGIVGIPPAGISLLAGQFLHFQYYNQQFYLAALDIITGPGRIDVPLPGALPLLLGGLGGLGLLGRMRRRRNANVSA